MDKIRPLFSRQPTDDRVLLAWLYNIKDKPHDERVRLLTDEFEYSLLLMYPDYSKSIRERTAGLRTSGSTSEKEVITKFEEFTDSILRDIVTREMETRNKKARLADARYIHLGETLEYEIDTKDASILKLHFSSSLLRQPIDEMINFRNDLRLIARDIRTKPELANVRIISGVSWILFDKPELA